MTRVEERYEPVTEYETRIILDTESSSGSVSDALRLLGTGDPTPRSFGSRGLTAFSVPGAAISESEVEVALDTAKIAFTDLTVSVEVARVIGPVDPKVDPDALVIVPKTVIEYGVDVPVIRWVQREKKVIRDVVRVTLDDLYEYEDPHVTMVSSVERAIEKSGLGDRRDLTDTGKKLLALLEKASSS